MQGAACSGISSTLVGWKHKADEIFAEKKNWLSPVLFWILQEFMYQTPGPGMHLLLSENATNALPEPRGVKLIPVFATSK